MPQHAGDAPAKIDCKGATGRYLQIELPGDDRLMPQIMVSAHRASHPNIKNGRTQAYVSRKRAVIFFWVGIFQGFVRRSGTTRTEGQHGGVSHVRGANEIVVTTAYR